jgi:C-terminal processing protease CtpA/Prc
MKNFLLVVIVLSYFKTYSQTNPSLTGEKIHELENLCKVWGVLKYYHPTIQNGQIDWDTTLMLTIPKVLSAQDSSEYNVIIGDLISKPGKVEKLSKPYLYLPKDTFLNNLEFAWIKQDQLLNSSNQQLLIEVIENYRPRDNVYIKKEINAYYVTYGMDQYYYHSNYYPDREHSLLSLFRYWNVINYFYVYKKSMDENWDSVLATFIPRFLNVSSQVGFYFTMAELSQKINDCHSYYDNYNFNEQEGPIRSLVDGKRTPITLRFVENKTLVGNMCPDIARTTGIHIGDIVLSINGIIMDSIRNELRPYCGCSTPASVERNINNAIFLSYFAAPGSYVTLELADSTGATRTVNFMHACTERPRINPDSLYYFLSDSIGYMNFGKMSAKDVRKSMKMFSDTKGLIIDMRQGAGDITGLTLAGRLAGWKNAVYANGYIPDYKYPGVFTKKEQKMGLIRFMRLFHRKYKGKVVMLVNESDQSNDEIVILMLKANYNVTLIGSNTSGTTGEATSVLVQKNVLTYFSSSAITYPSGNAIQRVGIVPDITVTPTIEGVQQRKDEVLDRAVQFISTGK